MIDGKPEKYFPSNLKRRRIFISQLIIFASTLVVILVVVIILIMKILVNDPGSDEDDYDPDETVSLVFVTVDNRFRANLAKAFTWELVGVNFASILMSVVQAVVIMVFAGLFTSRAKTLTDNENHKTETEYEDALISKTFMFSFINSYMVLQNYLKMFFF